MEFLALFLFVIRVDQLPMIDGSANDAIWEKARPLTLTLTEPMGKDQGKETGEVTIRALHDGTSIAILAEWNDETKDDTHKTWIWNAEKKKYTQGRDLEDVFSISFPIKGKFTGDMLSPIETIWDVWHWKAARTNPAGFAMDKHHIHTFKQPKGKAKIWTTLDKKRKIWIARPTDRGNSPTAKRKKPIEYEGDQIAQYFAAIPTESQADITAKGIWADEKWTLELKRKLDTGFDDDAIFYLSKIYKSAIAIFDHEEHGHHSTTPLFQIKFVGKIKSDKKQKAKSQ